MAGHSVRLLKGTDPVIVGDHLSALINQLVGDGDRTLMVEEITDEHYSAGGPAQIGPLVDAAQTAPFLTERRVVIGRGLSRFTKGDQVEGLVGYLEDPLPSTDLILVWEKGADQDRLGTLPKALKTAVEDSGGEIIDLSTPKGKGADQWLERQLASSDVRYDAGARRLIAERLGEDRSRVFQVIATIDSTFGPGAAVSADDVAPYLGEAGDVPPWDLTDAIDSGDIAKAIDTATRMMAAGGRHPLQLMASLHSHIGRMVKLDGAAVAGEKQAAALLGMKGSTYPAKKAMTQAKKLGSARIANQLLLLADADLDVRGAKAWPPEQVVEVLVARLARISRTVA
jgi:DNA polymerase-3 subunit delta